MKHRILFTCIFLIAVADLLDLAIFYILNMPITTWTFTALAGADLAGLATAIRWDRREEKMKQPV